jgi:hypothetical protein
MDEKDFAAIEALNLIVKTLGKLDEASRARVLDAAGTFFANESLRRHTCESRSSFSVPASSMPTRREGRTAHVAEREPS